MSFAVLDETSLVQFAKITVFWYTLKMPRQALFDLAVNRAVTYAARLGLLEQPLDEKTLSRGLELWYLKTRFAYRIPLGAVVKALLHYPGSGFHWAGGTKGGWQQDEASNR